MRDGTALFGDYLCHVALEVLPDLGFAFLFVVLELSHFLALVVDRAHRQGLFLLDSIIEAGLRPPVVHELLPHPSLEIVDVLLFELLDRDPPHRLVPDLMIFITDHQRLVFAIIEPRFGLLVQLLDFSLCGHFQNHFLVVTHLRQRSQGPRVRDMEVPLLGEGCQILHLDAVLVVQSIVFRLSSRALECFLG